MNKNIDLDNNLILFDNTESFDLIEDVVKNKGKNLDELRKKSDSELK